MSRTVAILIGASGAGKTAVASVLAEKEPWRGNTFYSDTIGVPSPEEMERWEGGGEGWQRWATEQWVSKLAGRQVPLQLLEMQTRPSFILPAMAPSSGLEPRIVLLDCSAPIRRFRLAELRKRPDLASSRMENWAIYLRGQADALGLPVIQTDNLTLEEVAAAVEAEFLISSDSPAF